MKRILFLAVLFAAIPFLGRSEESGIKVQTPEGSFEVKTGTPAPPADPQVIVVRPSKTTVNQPQGSGGCSCSLDSGASCK